jgi:hypothetical protein
MFRSLSLSGIILVTGLMTISEVVADDSFSANSIMPGCHQFLRQEHGNAAQSFDQGTCFGFIRGLAGLTGCRPPEVTQGQLISVVVQYIDARPARTHEYFGRLALEAITAAWPCQPGRKSK